MHRHSRDHSPHNTSSHSRDHSPNYTNNSNSHRTSNVHTTITNSVMLDVVNENSHDSGQSHHRHHSIIKSSHGNFLGDNNPHINPNYNNGYKAPMTEVDIEGSAYNIYNSNMSNKSEADLYVSHVGDHVEEGVVVQVNKGKGH